MFLFNFLVEELMRCKQIMVEITEIIVNKQDVVIIQYAVAELINSSDLYHMQFNITKNNEQHDLTAKILIISQKKSKLYLITKCLLFYKDVFCF